MDRSSFKKFDGEKIPDVIEYIKEYIEKNITATISVGTDSVQRRRKTVYAITIMLYDTDIKNGAHVIFFRENITKVRDHFDRLQRESVYALEVAEMLDIELSKFYQRNDLSIQERRRYKYHLLRCSGQYSNISTHNEDSFINNLILTEDERIMGYKLVDIHVDYNPNEGAMNKKGIAKNKSNISYRAMVPYLRSMGYRVFAKPFGYASSSAADLLLRD